MGQKVCGTTKVTYEDPLALQFGKDERELGIKHNKDITCTNKQGKQNKQVMKILSEWAAQLRAAQAMYKDPSLSSDPIILKNKQKQIRCTYERPYKFLDYGVKGQAYKIIDFHDSKPSAIEVRDQIMQYFGVFLCFLADKPTLIQKIICSNQNSYGIHVVQAYKEGKNISFIIDDYILCREKSVGRVEPVFSQPQKNMYMWPCLLQKAWFKLKGNAAKRFQQNCPEEVFQTFLSFPIEKVYFNDGINFSGRQNLNKVFSSTNANFMNKGYICKSKKNPEHDIGLSGSKYYYILDTFLDEGKRMFYLRNPTGNTQFRGIYDKISPRLQDILQKKYIQTTPGNFLVDEEEFLEQMAEVLIVHYLPGSKITTYSIQFENEQEVFIGFDLKYKGLFNLSLAQSHEESVKTKTYYPLIYHVVRLSDMKLIGGNQNKQGCFGVKNTYLLDNFNEDSVSSKYLIRLKKRSYELILNIRLCLVGYYMQNIKFQLPTQFELAEKWQQFLRTEGSRQIAYSQSNRQKVNQIAHVVCWLGDIAFVYIQKRSKREEVSIEVCFPELMNLECISHPEITRSSEWKSYKVADKFMIIFEKVNLTAQTHIRQYHIEAY